ncbi:MAG TPA: helix-hairpin-helix domain-containing protein [Amoebophilaceae bacterium]|jgi:competence ComEA-like helix-hairpin-helix protein|nr:helix-hairpin-helix domain-containing protein [Amoebophilaceae bacterium]
MLNTLRDKIKRAFYFTHAESNGLIAILLLIVLLVLLPRAVQLYFSAFPKPIDRTQDQALLEETFQLLQQRTQINKLNINSITAKELAKNTGIDHKIANRLVSYRNKLGGFVSVEQYSEVYDMSAELQERLVKRTCIATAPKQLSLNHATFKELVKHPYISLDQAKAILMHRKKVGKFTAVAAIEQLPGYQTSWGKKISPYLSLD